MDVQFIAVYIFCSCHLLVVCKPNDLQNEYYHHHHHRVYVEIETYIFKVSLGKSDLCNEDRTGERERENVD